MKPIFVSMKEGQRVIRWARIAAYAVLVLGLSVAVLEGAAYALTRTWSIGALIVAVAVAAGIVVRTIVRAISYQEKELELTVESQ